MSYLQNSSNGWSTTYSEQGQLQNSGSLYQSEIVFQIDNPLYNQPNQYEQLQSNIKNEQSYQQQQQSEANYHQLASKTLSYIANYERISTQIKQAQLQQLIEISQSQKLASNRPSYNTSGGNTNANQLIQQQQSNTYTELSQNTQMNQYSTAADVSQLIFQNDQYMQKNENPTYLKYFKSLSEALKGNDDQNNLVLLNSCINEIQLLCEKKPKIKICQVQKQINQMNTLYNNQIEKQISDKEKEEAKVGQEQDYNNPEEIKMQNEQLIENQKKEEESKKQQHILNSQCALCLDKINSHINFAPQYFKDVNQYFQAKCKGGHYISKICLAYTYQCIFQDYIPKSKKEYDEMLQKKAKQDALLICNYCNYKLEMDEVLQQNQGYLNHVRQNRKQFECGICIVDYDLEEEGISMFDCDHIFCIQCLTSYIIQCINQNKFRYEDFKCPQDKCSAIINNYIVDRLINTPENQMLFNRMIRMQLIHTTFKKEKIALCPGFQMRNKQTNIIQNVDQETITLLRLGIPPQLSDEVELIGCTTFFSYDENKVQFYECSNCKYKSCLKGCEDCHQKGSKRGKNCAEFNKWKKQNQDIDKDLMAIFDKETMCQCPKCKAVIIRNGGCNHITCTMPNCGFQFCFKCQSKWLCWKHFHYF
ncbi:hypothetical protein ABPG74_014237 [Tetrahymena malaccensis]